MSHEEYQIRSDLMNDFVHYASTCLKIRTKLGNVEKFTLNKAQKYIHDSLEAQKRNIGKVRALILKGRQQGCSSYVGGRFFHKTTHNFGVQCFILTHALDATNNLYKMAQRFYDNVPNVVKPQASTNNSKELIFGGLDSGYKIGTAENKSVGRSSTIQLFHGSEVAFWQNASEHAKGILQAVPDMIGTEIILESTANGIGNYFHQMWQTAEAKSSDFIPIFVPWFWQEEYSRPVPDDFKITFNEVNLQELYGLSLEQLSWRRNKIIDLSVNGQDGEKAFCQEYPCNPNEAFQLTGENSLIDTSVVMMSRKGRAEKFGPLILGVDPARYGDDRTSLICRQGRKAFDLVSYNKKDTMEVVGIIHQAILKYNPDAVAIDMGGLGAGVFDRLKELGHENRIYGINGGATPLDAIKYYNKRAEMWGLMNEWLRDLPSEIPDMDSLHADLCGIRYKINSNSQLVLEQKDEMKKRGVRSPDEADALALTFALPPQAFRNKEKKNEVVTNLASDMNQKLRAIKRRRI